MRLFAIYSIILTFFNISFLFAENIYQISNIIANAKMDNPTSSRQLALDEARRRAFINIATQKLEYQIAANELFSDQEIEQIIRSQQISDEKFADNEYWATLNIFLTRIFVTNISSKKT